MQTQLPAFSFFPDDNTIQRFTEMNLAHPALSTPKVKMYIICLIVNSELDPAGSEDCGIRH